MPPLQIELFSSDIDRQALRMAAWHYDLFLVAERPLDPQQVIGWLSTRLPELASPSQKLRLWGTNEGDRMDFWVENSPVELLARFDLRSSSPGFQDLVLTLASEFAFGLVNADDVTVDATLKALQQDIESSAAHLHVTNPPAEDDDAEDAD